jgi:virulence factor Mce-like protein
MSTRVRIVAVGTLIATVAVVVLAGGSSSPGHRVSFEVAEAADLMPGLKVRAAGQQVGEIASLSTVDGGRAARVELKLWSDKVWPLPRDTRLRLRFGGTIAYSQRYVALDRGTATGAPIPDGGSIPSSNVDVPVEFDELFGTFGPRTRHNLRATVDAAGRTLRPSAASIRNALPPGADLVEEARGAVSDLGADGGSVLATLVRSSDRVVTAARRARPGISPLLQDASTTFAALGGRASDLRQMLAELPATLTAARVTLRRADGTLEAATQVTSQLRPGVERLVDITPPLNHALGTLTAVAPDARATLATARRAAPDLTGLLDRATALMPDVTSIGEQAAPQLRCVRPYAPEIAGWASTWSGFLALGDGKDKYARLFNSVYPFPNDTPFGIPTAAKLVPGAFASYAFPRPPGANVGQPWFQPACGITSAGLDPAKNPEAGR